MRPLRVEFVHSEEQNIKRSDEVRKL